MSKEHELAQLTSQMDHLTKERELLLRTTEMYEVDKRDLQDEVRGEERFGRLVRSWTVSAFLSQIIACTLSLSLPSCLTSGRMLS